MNNVCNEDVRIRQQYCLCHDGHCETILYLIGTEYNDFTPNYDNTIIGGNIRIIILCSMAKRGSRVRYS